MGTSVQDPKEQQLQELDEEVEALKRKLEEATGSFGDALDEVSRRTEVDGSLQRRLLEIGRRLKELQPTIEALNFDVEQTAEMYSAILDVDRAVHGEESDLDRFEEILLGIERVRQVVRDALDEFIGGRRPDRRELVQRITDHLPGISQQELAELAGVTPRTLRRWATSGGSPSDRLLLVAKLVQILHHAWSPKGVHAWFGRPRPRLEGRRPLELLDDPGAERVLLAEARGSRNQYAT